jgi:hypothetical protein
MNHHSSRSHTIFRITVQSITNRLIRNYRREQSQLSLQTLQQLESSTSSTPTPTPTSTVTGALITESVLNFVDLAGSEKVSNHSVQNMEDSVYEYIIPIMIIGGKREPQPHAASQRASQGGPIHQQEPVLPHVGDIHEGRGCCVYELRIYILNTFVDTSHIGTHR